MLKTETKSPIVEKTEELCQTILDQPAYQDVRTKLDAFVKDEAAQQQYSEVLEQQNELQAKQQQGESLTQDEVDDFNRKKEELFENKVAKDFLDAQQDIHKVQETVNQYVNKTFELGRMPQNDDFEEGSCGPNCGCH